MNEGSTLKKIKEGFAGQKMIVVPPNIKRQIVKNLLINRCHITAMGYYPKATYHNRERKTGSGQYILIYCTEGCGHVKIGPEQYELQPNTYLIIPKNIGHHYFSSVKKPWSIYWLHFAGDFADLLFERHQKNAGTLVKQVKYKTERMVLFESIFNHLENSFTPTDLELANLLLIQFLSSLIYREESDPVNQPNDQIAHSIQHMKQNLSAVFTIRDLARQQNLSVSYYCKLFKEKTGHTAVQYFNLLKVQKSCQHLYFGNMNVKQICVELGFSDPYYFSRLFKKIMGVSPSGYKKSNTKPNEN